jgi:hypothetical protein
VTEGANHTSADFVIGAGLVISGPDHHPGTECSAALSEGPGLGHRAFVVRFYPHRLVDPIAGNSKVQAPRFVVLKPGLRTLGLLSKSPYFEFTFFGVTQARTFEAPGSSRCRFRFFWPSCYF